MLKKKNCETHYGSNYTENELCTILKCGLSKYRHHLFKGTTISIELANNTEYCSVELAWSQSGEPDHEYVKAEYLQIYNND